MKLYAIVVMGALFIAIMVGWILPSLFSAKSTSAVIVGLSILLLLPIFIFKIYHLAVHELENEGKNEEMELRHEKHEQEGK